MIRRTVKDVRPELIRLAGVSGLSISDGRFLTYLNTAVEELMNEGDWPGVVDRYRFAIYDGYISLPGDLDRVIGLAIDNEPIDMRSPWFEFISSGPGPQDRKGWIDALLDRGEAPTFRDIPLTGAPFHLRVVADLDERSAGVRPKIIIQGYDETGEWVRTLVDGEWIDGEMIAINGDAAPRYIDSMRRWTHVSAVIKPITKGPVRLWIWNYDGLELSIANYAPIETLPSYRRYQVPSLSVNVEHTVIARCRKRFVPVSKDNDFLIISNAPALAFMMRALAARDADRVDQYLERKGIAVNLLAKEALSYRGNERSPAITFSDSFGIGGIPNLR